VERRADKSDGGGRAKTDKSHVDSLRPYDTHPDTFADVGRLIARLLMLRRRRPSAAAAEWRIDALSGPASAVTCKVPGPRYVVIK